MKFKIGDVCITQGSRMPVLNDNQLVVIVAINPRRQTLNGEYAPYSIRRIDGQSHPYTTDARTGEHRWYNTCDADCPERMLRKPKKGDLPAGVVRSVAHSAPATLPNPPKVSEGAPT